MRCVDGSSVVVMCCMRSRRGRSFIAYVHTAAAHDDDVRVCASALIGSANDQSQPPINMNRFTVSVTPGLVQSLEGGVPPVGGYFDSSMQTIDDRGIAHL